MDIARANSRFQRQPIELTPVPKIVTSWKSAFEKDPFEVPIENKIEFLLHLNEIAMKVPGVGFVDSSLSWVSEQKFYGSTDGSRIEQHIVRGYPEFTVTAVDRATHDFQTRNSLGGPQCIGYEYVEKYPWLEEAAKAGEEAVGKLKARPIEPG